MIREEIDQTPGFRELTGSSELPASVDAERTIIGAIMLDNAALDQTKEIKPDDYSLDSHRRIFLAMNQLKDAGSTIDIVTLSNHLGEDGCKEIGGVAYLASLTEGLPRHLVTVDYIAIVKEKAKLRSIIGGCEAAIKACMEQQVAAADIVGGLGVALKGIRKVGK
jgi:replicative DNA helicase